jgi:hypothetical protein
MSVFQLSKWAVKRIDKIFRNFLWKGSEEACGGHCMVNWISLDESAETEIHGRAWSYRLDEVQQSFAPPVATAEMERPAQTKFLYASRSQWNRGRPLQHMHHHGTRKWQHHQNFGLTDVAARL